MRRDVSLEQNESSSIIQFFLELYLYLIVLSVDFRYYSCPYANPVRTMWAKQ